MDWLELREHHLADQEDDNGPVVGFFQAVVVATHTGPNRIDIHEAGDTTVTIPNVSYMASYSPTNGDTVWLLRIDEDRIVLGKLA